VDVLVFLGAAVFLVVVSFFVTPDFAAELAEEDAPEFAGSAVVAGVVLLDALLKSSLNLVVILSRLAMSAAA
jgi:hypothetical protein